MSATWMRFGSSDDGNRGIASMSNKTWWTCDSLQVVDASDQDVTNNLPQQTGQKLYVKAALRNLGPVPLGGAEFQAWLGKSNSVMGPGTAHTASALGLSKEMGGLLALNLTLPPCTVPAPGSGQTLYSPEFDASELLGMDQASVALHAWANTDGQAVTLDDWDPIGNRCDALRSVTVVTGGHQHVDWPQFHIVAGPAPGLGPTDHDPIVAELIRVPESLALAGGTRAALHSAAGVEYVRVSGATAPALNRGLRLVGRELTLKRASAHFALRVDRDTLVPLRFPRAAPRFYGLSSPTLGTGRSLKLTHKRGKVFPLTFSMQLDESNRPGDTFFFDVVKREPVSHVIGAAARIVVIVEP